jgi:hypothetical protein
MSTPRQAAQVAERVSTRWGEPHTSYRVWTLTPSCDASCDIVMTGSSQYFEDE